MQNYYYGMEKNSNNNIPEENCYYEDYGERKVYKELFQKIKKGDTLYIENLLSLGETSNQIQTEWDLLRERGIEIIVCDCPELDTRKLAYPISRYIAYILKISDLMHKNYVEKRKEAQKSGMKKAQENGVHVGRPNIISNDEFKKNYMSLSEKGFTDQDIYKIMGISHVSGIKYKKIMNGTYVKQKKRCEKKYEHPGRPLILSLEEFTTEYNKYYAKGMSDKAIYEKLGISQSTGKKYKKKMLQNKNQE